MTSRPGPITSTTSNRLARELVLRPGEVAELDTEEPHWFGPNGTTVVEILHLFGPHGDQAVART
ncbi:hypothetical protein BFN03_00155 [Rhodococcus sp. WMMA185]|uniref:hypothetical protein n=1 Tax=Rhodococcus sp. WMMA185 TaxID=679318 RepID=UPI000878E05D|nr:hypothetical protein [Rhodococcus sp. WMMA185]AOW91617.1 hypothetical protein BFN03_00155 [Rhodococcus sp. WMMA185]